MYCVTSARSMVTPLPGPGSATTCQRHTDLVKTARLQRPCRQVDTRGAQESAGQQHACAEAFAVD